MTNAFETFWAKGYTRLLPVVPYHAPLRNAGKRPGLFVNGEWQGRGSKTFDATPIDLMKWNAMGAGVGLRADGDVIGLDVDTLDPDWSEKIARAARKHLGPGAVRIGRAPKVLLLYRVTEPMTYRQVKFKASDDEDGLVELQAGDAKWFVVDGVHPATGSPYHWPDGVPAKADLPLVTPDAVNAFMDRLKAELPAAKGKSANSIDRGAVDQAALVCDDVERLRSAMAAIPNRHAESGYAEWIEMAVALRGAFQEDEDVGLDLFLDWTEKSDLPEQTEDPVRAYRSLTPPFAFGADYIYAKARRHHWSEISLEAIADPEPSRKPEPAGDMFGDSNVPEPQKPEASGTPSEPEKPTEQKSPHRLYNFEDYADVTTAGIQTNPALIKGLLDQGAMSVLYGDSNVGKTFVAMDMAFHIGASLNYAGLRTTGGLVVYVAAEGGRGARKRLVALHERFPGIPARFKLLASSVNLLDEKADLAPLSEALKAIGQPISLLVVDTLSRAMAGGDENSSTDMGKMVRHLDALRSGLNPAHMMVVHHTGKDKAKGARGHSLLRAATDTEIEVSDGVITVTKQRDMDKSWSSGFALVVHRLGLDADGDPITSCTVRLEGVTEATKRELTEGETAVMNALGVLSETADAGDGCVRIADLKAWFKDSLSTNALNAHIANLGKKQCVERPKRGHLRIVDVRECVADVRKDAGDLFM